MLNLVANGPSGYTLSNSLRFRSSASAYLNRTPAVAGNRKTWTWSGWIKLGIISVNMETLFIAQGQTAIYVNDGTNYSFRVNGAAGSDLITNLMPRDPASWYHLVVACDTTQATDVNRLKIYVNGVQQTSFQAGSAYPTLNGDTYVNSTAAHYIGRRVWNSDQQYDGYLTEVNFIDGQALTPSSFGSTNATTGVWQPAKYSGSYGTNGFYLNFSNIALTSGSNTGLGKDYSGNGNYWNTNNISVTSGTTYDAMTDVPTLTSATVANYCTLNPIGAVFGTPTFSNANLTVTATAGNDRAIGTIFVSSGKWYWEATAGTVGSTSNVSVASDTIGGYAAAYRASGGTLNLTGSPTFNSYTSGDIIGVALDIDSGTVAFYKNGVQQGTGFYTYTASSLNMYGHLTYFSSTGTGNSFNLNFGQRPFSYTPPTGYVALNTYNLPTSTIVQGNKYMDATLYTGNGGATQTITNAAGFKPDFVWVKCRSVAYRHGLFDSVRGVGVSNTTDRLQSNATDAQDGGPYMSTLNSNGFTITNYNATYTENGQTYVAWQWQAGQGSTSSNTSGSITSTVSVNTTAGFSVVTYTGNSTTNTNYTVGHGLGVAPKLVIIKSRTWAAASSAWPVWHTSSPSALVYLDSTDAASSGDYGYFMGSTAPTSSVFTVRCDTTPSTGARFRTFGAYNYVAYCWAEIAGFSKFGSYTGNASADGPFVYCGFRPKFVMIKSASNAYDWLMYDTSRNTYNLTTQVLYADLNLAEGTGTIYDVLDILSNGFKIKGTNNAINGSGYNQIFMAFAENPFKNALAR